MSAMASVVLGLVHNWSRLCHKSMRRDVVIMLVPSSSPVTSPSVRFRRSKPLSPWSAQEVGDDIWGQVVSDSVFQNGIFLFSVMDE